MTEAPERRYCVECGETTVRADRYDEAVRQRDALLEAAKDAEETIRALRITLDATEGLSLEDSLRSFVLNTAKLRAAIAACAPPPLARGDVKTGKVVRDGA